MEAEPLGSWAVSLVYFANIEIIRISSKKSLFFFLFTNVYTRYMQIKP